MTDAGVHPSDHYRLKMSKLRFQCRSYILWLIRNETQALAKFQHRFRCPAADRYFALTANLGTHLFYMFFLPIFFLYGNHNLGSDFVWGLAIGVGFTGIVKDWLCLPRPLSPPVHRISMSGSACLEYGFPSTHSCNALTIALVLLEHNGQNIKITHYVLVIWLIATIVVGRLYSGMHGMLDVSIGSLMGIAVYFARVSTRSSIVSAFRSNWAASSILGLLTLSFVITIHPQPVDDCPCFDDTVAFLSVLWGVEAFGTLALRQYGNLEWPSSHVYGVLRIIIGVAVIVVWRIVAKKTMLKVLPPILRSLRKLGVYLPRQFYTPANLYDKPQDVPGETVIDSPKLFKETVSNLRRHRGRSDSVGVQSEHDYYEALAAYEKNKTSKKPELKQVTQPRKRYDVEVITKVTVYSGIPLVVFWIAIPLCKLLDI